MCSYVDISSELFVGNCFPVLNLVGSRLQLRDPESGRAPSLLCTGIKERKVRGEHGK